MVRSPDYAYTDFRLGTPMERLDTKVKIDRPLLEVFAIYTPSRLLGIEEVRGLLPQSPSLTRRVEKVVKALGEKHL